MHPIFDLGLIKLSVYALFNVIAASIGVLLYINLALKCNISKNEAQKIAFWIVISILLGSRLFNILIFLPKIIVNPPSFFAYAGGSKLFGAIIGVGITILIYSKKKALKPLILLDIIALIAPIIQGVGRIGCFMTGCCYGIKTNSFLGVAFPHIDGTRHPTQIYEIVFHIFLFIVLYYIFKRNNKNGVVFSTYLIIYGTFRFFIDFLRGDFENYDTVAKSSQSVAVFCIIGGIVLILYINNKERKK